MNIIKNATASTSGIKVIDGVKTVIAGDSVTYTVIVSNDGPSTAPNVKLIDFGYLQVI